jgi:hypothetical protein
MTLKFQWPIFETQWLAHLKKGGNTIENNSKKIAELYHKAVQNAVPKQVPGFSPFLNKFLTLTPAPVEAGFKTSFTQISQAKVEPGPSAWTPAAAGIVAYWTGKLLTPTALPPLMGWIGTGPGVAAPPPAGGLPSGILPYLVPPAVIFPGTPAPLNAALHKAFHQEKEEKVAKFTRKALEDHAKTITGVLAATIPPPGVPPAPAPPIPWVGIE